MGKGPEARLPDRVGCGRTRERTGRTEKHGTEKQGQTGSRGIFLSLMFLSVLAGSAVTGLRESDAGGDPAGALAP